MDLNGGPIRLLPLINARVVTYIEKFDALIFNHERVWFEGGCMTGYGDDVWLYDFRTDRPKTLLEKEGAKWIEAVWFER